MSGTDTEHAGSGHCAVRITRILGTDLTYAAMLCAVLTLRMILRHEQYYVLSRFRCALYGTSIAYDAIGNVGTDVGLLWC
eukprot:3941944-Rhodomonas_salina.3